MTPEQLDSKVAAFLRQGGAITKLNYAGEAVGVVTEELPDLAIVQEPLATSVQALEPEPVVAAAPELAGEPVRDLIADLRDIRREAIRLLTRLNAAS